MGNMENNNTKIAPKTTAKSFMTAGPTLHYSHDNVLKCLMLTVIAYAITCIFWSKMLTGNLWSFDYQNLASPQLWQLSNTLTTGVTIFEYPWLMLVVAMMMSIILITPILISQLMSFRYSLIFIILTATLANLPGFAICLIVSSIAVACRPLRFRSRFISIALCTMPSLLYYGFFGQAKLAEPIQWGFSITPWIGAWIFSLAIAGLVLGIGHFTRYKPGLVWITSTAILITAVIVFEKHIGFAELDYQLYIAKNDPQQITQLHDHSITEAMNKTISTPAVKEYIVKGYFYPTEQTLLRAKLKEEIKKALSQNRWPSWFIVPDEFDYQKKKQSLMQQYDLFINKRPQNKRMPIALYYKALLDDFSPDLKELDTKEEILHFYFDYPSERSRETWYRLYSEFGNSPESIEARWRIAMHWAGQGRFEQANNISIQAQNMINKLLQTPADEEENADTIFSTFKPPADTAMTNFKLMDIKRRLNRLQSVISPENRTEDSQSDKILSEFVMINRHSLAAESQLNDLLEKTNSKSPLRDNILLEQIKLIKDHQLKSQQLKDLHKKYKTTDGGQEALYELALLKIKIWREQPAEEIQIKKDTLTHARNCLTDFIKLYPDSIFTLQAQKNLQDLPSAE